MQRYFIDESLEINQHFQLDDSDNHHLVNVMRSKINGTIHIVDSKNRLYLTRIHDIIDGKAMLEVIDLETVAEVELAVKVTIACGLSKNDKLDYIVQKATEIGMHEFIPLALERDVVKWPGNKIQTRIDRLQKIAKEASEQSKRIVVPQIKKLTKLSNLINKSVDYDYIIVAYEEFAKQGKLGALKEILSEIKSNQSILVVFGSEGGISESEIHLLQAANFQLISLGPRILRAETAPIYLLSAISYHLEL